MIKRVLVFKVKEDASPEQVATLERELLRMPEEIPSLRWHRLGHNVCSMRPGQVPYTHIWETAYDDVQGLQVYTTHPFHTDVVHPFFDAASPTCVVEQLLMVYYECPGDAAAAG